MFVFLHFALKKEGASGNLAPLADVQNAIAFNRPCIKFIKRFEIIT